MKRKLAIAALAMVAIIGAVLVGSSSTRAEGATQISGTGTYAAEGACTDPEGAGADYVLTLTGSLTGCHYVFVESYECTAGGAYKETGTEIFVGTFNGQQGTFRTTYLFTAKYLDCPNLVGEVTGRCQHPFVNNSGTGVFAGIKEARLDMRDDVAAGNFPYKGHIQF